jgi:NADH-quinone oxidoreductase subunit G
MAQVTINGQTVTIENEKNILELVRKAGIDLPTFCYHSELSVYGACRMCTVEVEKMGLVAACSTPPSDGMVIRTNTERTLRLRRMVIELLLANHNRDCTTCDKSGACKLQDLAYRLGVRKVRFGEREKMLPIDDSSPSIVRDPNKCILCGDCVRVCSEVQGIGVLDFAHRGSDTVVTPAFGKLLKNVDCVNCGQCVAVCPTGALQAKSQVDKVWQALNDPTKKVVAQIAPAVRVALAEEFGGHPGDIVTGKIVAGMKRAGFDRVFDTVFTADLTAIEECNEFLGRLQRNEHLPIFTSCCPGWVKFAEQYYPELLDNLSTCKSPQGMFGSIAKNIFAGEMATEAKNMFVVSVMPCTAKKFEAQRPELTTDGTPDVDAVLTTTELAQLLKQSGVVFDELEAEAFDSPLGLSTGAGVIFGVTGGVSEAVLRVAAGKINAQLDRIDYKEVRGFEGIREANVKLGDVEVHLAVVHGLGNVRKLLSTIKSGEKSYHIVEVMACPNGCVGGGGQPHPNDTAARHARAKGLYQADKAMQMRCPQDNLAVERLYERQLADEHTRHEFIHTNYGPRRRLANGDIALNAAKTKALEVSVCVGTGCYLRGAYDVLETFTALSERPEYAGRLNLSATFCLEHCDRGVSVRVGDRIITGVSPATAKDVFMKTIVPLLGE